MTLFTRINTISNDLSLPVIPDSDIDYFLPLEPTSYDHWMFNRGANSLVGIANGKTLTPGATAPVFKSSYVSLSTEIAGALTSDKGDGANQTMCVVYRRPSANTLRYLAGTLNLTGGSSLYATGTSLGSIYANQRPSAQIGPITHSGAEGSWVFAAFSEKSYPASKDQIIFVGGQTALKTNVGPKVIAPRMIALCNGYDAASGVSVIDFAEFIIFDKSMTEAELGALYLRTKSRMAAIGITV